MKYDDVAEKLDVSRKIFSPWWDELKEERLAQAVIRDKWLKKCPEAKLEDFKLWHQTTEYKCHYCNITPS